MPIEYVDLAAAREAMEREQELHSLPELFLENTRLRPHHSAHLRRRLRELATPHWRNVLRQSCKTYASSLRVPLSDPDTPCTTPSFDEVARRSRRFGGTAPRFLDVPLPGALLSHLLFYSGGRGAPADALASPGLQAFPLPAELNPIETYVVVTHAEDVPAGVYHFNAWLHCLETLEPGSRADLTRRLAAVIADGTDPEGVAAAVVTTAVPLRVSVPYGDRGYRMMLAEAGRVAERIDLGAAALGLLSCPVPNFFDDRVDRLLGIDGVDEFVVALCLVGRGIPEAAR